MENFRDIIIIGGGASGIAAAIKSAEKNSNKKITIIEKQSKLARKLLSTGNGRCNFTNVNADKNNYHGTFANYVENVFDKYPPKVIIDEFKRFGLMAKVESEGRVYPVSNHASAVVDVLLYKLESLNIEIKLDTKIISVKKDKNKFIVKTDKGEYVAEKVVISTGSKAAKKLGADGSGLDLLRNLGHTVNPLKPALCPIPVTNKKLATLKGIRATGKVTLISNGKTIKSESGEIQFTENSLSGICVFNLATFLKNNGKIIVSLLPKLDDNAVKNMINEHIKIFKDRPIEDLFTGIFQKKLAVYILKECIKDSLSRKISTLNSKETDKLAYTVNHWKFEVKQPTDFDKAQVVSGGVSGKEINPNTMESKIIKGLYICGEAIDIDGDCGGYNLQFAFASGFLAGENL